MSKANIFVYGTLKCGECRASVLKDQVYLGKAVTEPKYNLYELGSFPGLKDDGNNAVEGEAWEVDEICLRRLDGIEGIPYLYDRRQIKLISHPDIICQTYIYQGDVSRLENCGKCWKGR